MNELIPAPAAIMDEMLKRRVRRTDKSCSGTRRLRKPQISQSANIRHEADPSNAPMAAWQRVKVLSDVLRVNTSINGKQLTPFLNAGAAGYWMPAPKAREAPPFFEVLFCSA